MNMKAQLFIALVFLLGSAQAEIYRSVDKQGNPVFSDLPDKNSSPVKLKAPSTYSAPQLPPFQATSPRSTGAAATSSLYKQFAVTAPGQGQSFWDNAGDVRVSLSLEPALKTELGHRVQFYLDGVAQGEPVTTLTAVINNVERGEHTLSAKIISAGGAEIQHTEPVRFQLHRQSLNFPARKKASPGS